MTERSSNAAETRVWAATPSGTRERLVAGLSPTDLQTLLLAVARERSAGVSPGELLRRWRGDRFVRPASTDPRVRVRVEARLWELLPELVEGVELSPVTPLGTCSALATVSQNKIVSTMRLTEVVSDSTNVLALEAAARRRAQPSTGTVHLAASQRQLRAQELGPHQSAHFGLLALVSSSRDTGSGRTEARLLVDHLGYWQRVLATLAPAAEPQIRVTVLDAPVVEERLRDAVLPALAQHPASVAAPVLDEPERVRGRGYYRSAALRLTVRQAGQEVELGDGGFTSWTSQLLSDTKERCLVSCISVDGLVELSAS